MPLVKKPGCKTWVFQCQINGRTWNRTTGETNRKRAEAKIPELQRLAELHRGQPKGLPSLNEAIVRDVNRAEVSLSTYEAERLGSGLGNLASWAGDISLERITTRMLESYQQHRLKGGTSQSTIQKEICWIIRMLRRNGLLVTRPEPVRGKRSTNRPFTTDELTCFFRHCNRTERILFLVMLATGARPAELVPSWRSQHKPLLKNEVDVEYDILNIRTAKMKIGQESKVRKVKIPAELMEELVTYAGEVPGSFVFPTAKAGLKRMFDRILSKAGIEKVDVLGRKLTAHSFRHTYATLMAETVGNNPFILKQVLGHSQISTTDRYCHVQAPAVVVDIASYLQGAV
jgi:integrase